MPSIRLDVVTAERSIYSEDVDAVIAPGVEGELGILPHHAPLMTTLQPGELRIKKGGEEVSLSITGGFLEVRPDRVVVLADAAERADEIDVARAEEAKRRAEQLLADRGALGGIDAAQYEASLHRALTRLAVANKVRRKKGRKL